MGNRESNRVAPKDTSHKVSKSEIVLTNLQKDSKKSSRDHQDVHKQENACLQSDKLINNETMMILSEACTKGTRSQASTDIVQPLEKWSNLSLAHSKGADNTQKSPVDLAKREKILSWNQSEIMESSESSACTCKCLSVDLIT